MLYTRRKSPSLLQESSMWRKSRRKVVGRRLEQGKVREVWGERGDDDCSTSRTIYLPFPFSHGLVVSRVSVRCIYGVSRSCGTRDVLSQCQLPYVRYCFRTNRKIERVFICAIFKTCQHERNLRQGVKHPSSRVLIWIEGRCSDSGWFCVHCHYHSLSSFDDKIITPLPSTTDTYEQAQWRFGLVHFTHADFGLS